MYQHKSGYTPGDPIATHSRRRYRLLPSKFPNPAAAVPDQALWIIHYAPAEQADRIPSQMIPVADMRVQQAMQTRSYLQTQGQIVHKEFMLHDRANWPQIMFPQRQVRGPPAGYQNPMGPTRTPQAMAYPPHPAPTGPPAKRARTQAHTNQAPPPGAVPIEPLDDEEDTSRGDLFDHITPREISVFRYKQNHEWMEEIFSSPYSIGQIVPVDLGLGLQGELGSLTNGIFNAPTADSQVSIEGAYVGRLDPGKADEFRKRASEKIAEGNAAMEKMKIKHAKRMAKFKKSSLVIAAEKSLRTAVHDPSDIGPEYWRLEGRIEEDEDGTKSIPEAALKVDDIVAQVEASLGRHTAAVEELRRLQDGGLEESAAPSPPPAARMEGGSNQSGMMVDAEMDMGSAAGLLDQYHTGFSSTSTPGTFPTPQPNLQTGSAAGTPINVPTPQPHAAQAPAGSAVPAAPESMEGVERAENKEDGTGGDWVVVPPGGVSPPAATAPAAPSAAAAAPAHNTTQGQSLSLDLPENTFNTDPTDFSSLEDLDTAGEALAGYGGGGGAEGGIGDELDLGLIDDSAFGEAFHGVEGHGDGNSGEGEGDGL
jgi:flagellar motor switch/type III secretory pathway protein FliN